MQGPFSLKRCLTSKLVAEIIPTASAADFGTARAWTVKPRPRSDCAAVAACGAQSPGGLSVGTFTMAARNAHSALKRSSTQARMKSAEAAPGAEESFMG